MDIATFLFGSLASIGEMLMDAFLDYTNRRIWDIVISKYNFIKICVYEKSSDINIRRKEENIRKLKVKLSVECSKHADEAPLRYLVAVPAICK